MKTNNNFILVLLLNVFIIGLTSISFAQTTNDKFVVVLDAGHGGKDHGNLGNGYKEKSIALKVALQLGKELEKNNDFKVIYTRKTDVFIPLYKRADIANKADADLFISIHCNAVVSSKPYGTETWILSEKNTERNFEFAKRENEVIFLEDDYEKNYAGFDPSSSESTIAISIEQEVYVEQSIALAAKIEEAFKTKVKRKSRGVKQKSLLVIRNTYMPSVLVELGFLSNKKEGAFLNTKAGQLKMTSSIKEAIIAYKKELDQNIGEQIFDNKKPPKQTEGIGDIPKIKEETRIIEGVIFKVQIGASSLKLDPIPQNFKGLDTISRVATDNLYKYFYGKTSDYNAAKSLREQAKSKGYTSCFIVAYKNGNKISVTEALKTS